MKKHGVRAAVLGMAAGFALTLWVIGSAPPLVSFTLAVVGAVAWCVWLEQRPDGRGK
jgi:hypothetical protein